MDRKILTFSLAACFFSSIVTGQEQLSSLMDNPLLIQAYGISPGVTSLKALSSDDTLSLPFFDDFSYPGPYPDPGRWSDRAAYINSNMAANIHSMGVATLDILDDKGQMYSYATEQPFLSEYLTSRPIDLLYPDSDSLYLSFCYEPGGNVNVPEKKDSLVLEFWSPVTSSWHTMWKQEGFDADTFQFKIIPITESNYLRKGFRFRFKNYASLNDLNGLPDMTGNQDFWHLDYIHLDRNRTHDDTLYTDVAFVKPIHSLLRNYESMPWTHFEAAKLVEMGDKIGITYRNNGGAITLVTRFFQIKDLSTGSIAHSYTGGADNIDSYQTLFYNSNLIYTYASPSPDTAVFEVKSHLVTSIGDYKGNDTLRYYQKFLNYYAYDDGTAEKGYGLNGEGTANSRFAYQFKVYKPDTLQAVQMFFGRTYNDASQQEFILAVWNDNNGVPGDIIYQQPGLRPEYPTELNRYHTYLMNEPFVTSGIIYVGWIQTTEKSLFLGFDIDRISNDKAFYFISKNGAWLNSDFQGSFMIRPVFGEKRLLSNHPPSWDPLILLYPNPASDWLTITLEEKGNPNNYRLLMYDTMGRILREYPSLPERIGLADLPAGLYILRLSSPYGSVARKFYIIR
jgi:hypothetical protein